MSLAVSELIHTLGVILGVFALLTLLALFLKAESATWKKDGSGGPP